MQILITGKKIDIGEALRTYTEDKIRDLVNKYSLEPVDSTVVIARDGPNVKTEVEIHLGREVHIRAHAESDDAHFSVDRAVEVLETRIRKHKERLIDHQKKRDSEFRRSPAQQYVLNPGNEENNAPDAGEYPLIIAETKTQIPSLTVGEAVMHMDLGDQQAMIFHNEAHGRLNVIYRRPDGNIGWVDPVEE